MSDKPKKKTAQEIQDESVDLVDLLPPACEPHSHIVGLFRERQAVA